MIADKDEMKRIEGASGLSVTELMEQAGKACAEDLRHDLTEQHLEHACILILCGKGNNGGDGYVMARYLKDDFDVKVCAIEGKPKTEAALENYKKLSRRQFVSITRIKEAITKADLLVDAVYGFSYHGSLQEKIRDLFKAINESDKTVYAIDLNSGCEADTGHCDKHALRSTVTWALDCYKPFHLLKKNHEMFEEVRLLNLGLPHPFRTKWNEMNEEIFFNHFPKKAENAYKGTFGKTLIIGGSYGMAGAFGLNILGAQTVGASYINAACDEAIYAIAAFRSLTPVFHPFHENNFREVLTPLAETASAIAFGSGCTNMKRKNDVLDLVLQNAGGPVILDAEALRLLNHNTWILRFARSQVILTPHIGEFADILNQPTAAIIDHRIEYAKDFARKLGVIVVLKGPDTVVASPDGECYLNTSGNQALAQAGSGDLLTGIMAGILTMTRDTWTGVKMAVWLHGYLADLGIQNHSIQNFSLEEYPKIMDYLFKKHGF
jgi:hydroxyethylthiazole kinase-like uncharacterized protein yjeF